MESAAAAWITCPDQICYSTSGGLDGEILFISLLHQVYVEERTGKASLASALQDLVRNDRKSLPRTRDQATASQIRSPRSIAPVVLLQLNRTADPRYIFRCVYRFELRYRQPDTAALRVWPCPLLALEQFSKTVAPLGRRRRSQTTRQTRGVIGAHLRQTPAHRCSSALARQPTNVLAPSRLQHQIRIPV